MPGNYPYREILKVLQSVDFSEDREAQERQRLSQSEVFYTEDRSQAFLHNLSCETEGPNAITNLNAFPPEACTELKTH